MRFLTVLVTFIHLKNLTYKLYEKINFTILLCDCLIYFNNIKLNKNERAYTNSYQILFLKIINFHINFNHIS